MQDLTDSSPLVGDVAALRRRLAEDGYLFLRGLIPATDVQQVRAAVTSALDVAGWLADGSTAERPRPTSAAAREGAEGYLEAYVGIQRQQAFHELAHAPEMLDLLGDLLGGRLLVHPLKIARTSLPKDDEYTPPHQDYRLIQGSVDALTCWVPLGDCPRSLGGLRVLAGSHRQGLAAADPGRGPGGLTVVVDDDDPAWRTADYRSGDVILFTSLTVHGALPNAEDRMRLSADFRYQVVDEPVAAESLLPHYHPRVPGWAELTRGWTSTRSVTPPDGVVLADVLPPMDPALTAPPSRLLPVA